MTDSYGQQNINLGNAKTNYEELSFVNGASQTLTSEARLVTVQSGVTAMTVILPLAASVPPGTEVTIFGRTANTGNVTIAAQSAVGDAIEPAGVTLTVAAESRTYGTDGSRNWFLIGSGDGSV